ncbi:related to budding protein BOI2 [Rhynchosporium secalis]|uniref:Related to budding protein BOI2 n=1 Tax=Rhynchosporium secalis TaxID=38038 RepID=A0A1E1LX80_RHYSE|nr:related to budding protein BOI2 [Rhynchosporium secalis]
MASRFSIEPQGRPQPGQILLVIHDFSARSSDELSLMKGDRVELIERDDDFGDGWYLGRHLTNGNSGLFPEVYTRIAPRGPPSYPPISTAAPRQQAPAQEPVLQATVQQLASPTHEDDPNPTEAKVASPTIAPDPSPQSGPRVSASEVLEKSSITSPSAAPQELEKLIPPPVTSTMGATPSKTVLTAAMGQSHSGPNNGQDSPVMNETLSVIDEHITDMNSPHHSLAAKDRRGTNDSGSEYSNHLDQRMSFINGEETDEEEEQIHSREEVETWTPDQVAEYLFTSGVEAKHCEVFRDQEIAGDVLLGMDQTSVFLKEFDLGSVGRRLKTWQKIKALQDEVGGESPTRRNTATYGSTYGSDAGSDETGRNRNRSTTSPMGMLPRIPSMSERTESRQTPRFSSQQISRNEAAQLASPKNSPISPITIQDRSRPIGDRRRPSAASIRDMHHSRQSSVNEYSTPSIMASLEAATTLSPTLPEGAHKKQPSFDRNWTMGAAASPSMPPRPLSSGGIKNMARSSPDQLAQTVSPSTTFDPFDRGYFSGGEAEGRQRNVLRKKGSSATTAHSRNSSYADEQRLRTATAHSRHSRFGSVDSIRDSAPPSAAQKYYGLAPNGRRRTPSEASINSPSRSMPPPKDFHSPTVTKLEGNLHDNKLPQTRQGRSSDWLLPVKQSSKTFGLRTISDAVTGHEKRLATADPVTSPVKDSPIQSPSRTGSSTPSGPSLDRDSLDSKGAAAQMASVPKVNRKKTKKETSAYTRGLEKKSPREQMVGADYSGWMRKRGSNLMSSWKPRLFVLKGRRLSYYYSEDDDQEKGLIDISFHRVLPTDGDRLTGLSAAFTGATNSPTSPSGSQTVTMAETAAASEPESTLSKGTGDSTFIFKLVPPRAGAAKAVTFTKPTTHYFAVPNIKQGRLWMAALMKATIDRDDSKPVTTTYQQATISLAKARAMRHRPPALMNLDEHVDEEAMKTPASDKNGLNIHGIIYERDPQEEDSGVSGVSNSGALVVPESARGAFINGTEGAANHAPRTA